MDILTRREILEKLTMLGIDFQNDAELANGYFILGLIIGLKTDEKMYHMSIYNPTFESILVKFRIKFFAPKNQTDEDTSKIIDRLCDVLESNMLNNFETFFREFSPWIISDWDKYLENFLNKKGDGIKIAALYFLLESQKKLASHISIFDCVPVDLYNENLDISAFWTEILGLSKDQFASCWNAVFFHQMNEVPVAINGNISNAIKMYLNFHVPMTKLFSDYCDVTRYKKTLEKAVNPWIYINKGIKKIPVEMGLTVEETLFEKAAFYIKNEHATDVIRALFYPKSRNDSGFECSFLFKQFVSILTVNTKVLIVNPSPDFILKWYADKHLSSEYITYFAVPDDTVATSYCFEFSDKKFLPFEKIKELEAIDHVLIMSRDYPMKGMDQLISSISICGPAAKIIALLPSAYFDSSKQKIQNILMNYDCYIRKLLIVPSTATMSVPRKKILFYIEKKEAIDPPEVISIYTSFCEKNGQIFYVQKEHWDIPSREFYLSNRTILTMQKKAEYEKKNPSDEKVRRNPPEIYNFSKEIKITYTIQANRKNRFAGKAYYSEILKSDVKNRLHGNRLTEIIEKGLRASTESEVLSQIESVPFDPRVDHYIVSDILSAYDSRMDTVSLKTLWFCCRKVLLKRSDYDENIAKELFCGEALELSDICPSMAWESEFVDKMAMVIDSGTQNVQLKYWRQLHLILGTAMREKFIHYNPIAEYLRTLSSQATEEQREVRNALVKKTFSFEEERRMLDYICGNTNIPFGARMAKRYESESIWLVGVIRLFTGMATREICALKWSDFVKISNIDTYQFLVTKFVSSDGCIVKNPPKDDWKRFRKVPLVPELAIMLKERKKYLITVRNIQIRQLEYQPIILEKEQSNGKEKNINNSFCKPRYAIERCNKMTDAAGIPEQFLNLPDDDNQLITDINRYQGDVFRSNFKYRANHTCGLTRGEINYVLGIDPPDTFSRNYCDYTNDFIQFAIAQKLQRWTAEHDILAAYNVGDYIESHYIQNKSTDVIGPFSNGVAVADTIIGIDESCSDGELNIEIECDYGFSGDLIFYKKGGNENDASRH